MKAKPPKELIKALVERDMPAPAKSVQPKALLTARTEMDERQTEIFSFVERYLFEHENPAFVSKNVRFVTEGYDAFGLDDLKLKELRDELLTRFEPEIPEISALLYHFFATGKYEFGSLALLLLKKNRPRLDRSVFDELRRCLDKVVENWAHSDLIALKLTPVLLELNIVKLEDFADWVSSPSKWTRRVAAVTLISQRSLLSAKELLEFVRPLMLDSERAVQQGVGWFLRELGRNAPEEVEEFLVEYKDSASQNLLQYATEWMTKDKKRRFVRPQPKHDNKQGRNTSRGNQPERNAPRGNQPERNAPRGNQPERSSHRNQPERGTHQASSPKPNPHRPSGNKINPNRQDSNQPNAAKPFRRKPFKPRPPKENPDE